MNGARQPIQSTHVDVDWLLRSQQQHELTALRQMRAPGLPDVYAGIYKDWVPWKPTDVITLLGDIVRCIDSVG